MSRPQKSKGSARKKVTQSLRPRPAVAAAGILGIQREPSFYFKDAANITSVDFHQGERALDGRWINLFVNFATHSSPDGESWKIWPHEAIVYLVNSTRDDRVPLGTFRTYLTMSISPNGATAHKSGTASVQFQRLFTPLEIAALEEWRDGRDLGIKVMIYGFGKKGGVTTWDYFDEHPTTVPRSKWLDMLAQAQLQEKVLVAVPVPADDRLRQAAAYLRSAIGHHARGEYAAAAQTCRKALEEIGTAGFGRRAPKEVRDFVHQQDAKQYSLDDRVAVIMMAAKMFYNAAAHAGDEERQWSRADVDLAMALTAALMRVAPTRLADAVLADSSAGDETTAPLGTTSRTS
jgi:hypothetical protein